MDPQDAIRGLLQLRLNESAQKNPAYSARTFARRLNINSGTLSGILSGKRRVSRCFAEKLVDQLISDPQEREAILRQFSARPPVQGPPGYSLLKTDQFQLISDWYHFAILSLVEIPQFRGTPPEISRRLGIPIREAKSALQRLLRLGLIRTDRNGKLHRSAARYRTSDGVPSTALRRAHTQNLELAGLSLERDQIEKNDFTAITMAIDPAKLARAKEKIRRFQDEMAELLESGSRTDVYKMCIQLFPLTREEAQ